MEHKARRAAAETPVSQTVTKTQTAMVKLEKTYGKKGIFPKMAMCAVAIASFMDSFCMQVIVPNLPFAVQKWFPKVFCVGL